jgi:DNA-binding HxlR family transcriptional regulator
MSTAQPPKKRHPYDQWAPDARALDLVGDKWTLLIVRDLATGPRRFVELHRVLPGISTEQLRSRLHRMVADGLLTRERYREVPPRVEYELTPRARDLEPIIGELVRWGRRHEWTSPRDGERVDVGAVLRGAPGLGVPDHAAGVVEVVVNHDDEPVHYRLTAENGRLTVEEQPTLDPHATVHGTHDAWVAALGPEADHATLEIVGDRGLAETVLKALSLLDH